MDSIADAGRIAPLADIAGGRDQGAQPRTVLIGAETLLPACAEILIREGHEIIAVAAPAGPAADWAQRQGSQHFADWRALLTADLGRVDYLFSITNLSVLPPELLSLATRAAINFHDGPLPEYAGLNTPVWALMAGEDAHAVTWHLMTDTVDGGDVLQREPIAIDAGETALSLNTKCFEAGLRSFERLVGELNGGRIGGSAQGQPAARWFGRGDRPACAATIDWAQPAERIARMVRALDFGTYANPMGMPKVIVGDQLYLVQGADAVLPGSGLTAGTVVADGFEPLVATGEGDLRLTRLFHMNGGAIDTPIVARGQRLPTLEEEQATTLGSIDGAAALYEPWWRNRLMLRDPLLLAQFQASAVSLPHVTEDVAEIGGGSARDVLARVVACLARVADRSDIDIGYTDPVERSRIEGVSKWFAAQLPLRLTVDFDKPIATLRDAIDGELGRMHRRIGIAADLIARTPGLARSASFAHPVAIEIVDRLDDAKPLDETILHIAIASDGSAIRWSHDPARYDSLSAEQLRRGFRALSEASEVTPGVPVGRLALLSPGERQCVLVDWNATAGPVDVDAAIVHHAIARQAEQTPNRVAVVSRGVSLTYHELDARTDRLARHLRQSGVKPEVLVGLCVTRSVDMVVAMLAILKAGGAYVPLDPAYPQDRLAYMIEDSGLTLVVAESATRDILPDGVRVITMDRDALAIAVHPAEPFDSGVTAENLAYVIYTSGSTGRPKGVMIEHRNLANFFAGMDAKLEPDGTWLAVTSPNFDISVLELMWPLTRGYKVVVATEREVRGDVRAASSTRPLDFSLFYFASAEIASNQDQYRLLIEGAKFADANGFEAVWTPERHFHAFGGLYPNPSVVSAALAMVTSRVKIRAGSVVAPLHHPARIAEEWALVDNLSNGRVGIAFASGWQPDDFLLRPENFADRTGALMRSIDDVRGLWRGEKRSFAGPLGKDVSVGVYPRPVQPELPIWITSAGNPETFAAAGRAGAYVLTHLLGQSVEEVAVKLDAYRHAWREAGHAGEGHVTLMLHSFVGPDRRAVREVVRGPLIEYLRTSTNLLKQYAWSFPAFKRPSGMAAADLPDLGSLTPGETDALLEHAFDRYFDTSGLFGTPEDVADMIDRLRAVGVDEIGCLIDFGIPAQTVLDHLPYLDRVRQLAQNVTGGEEVALAELMARHDVSHLQCTPSLLQMLASDESSRDGLAALGRLMVGGEAFPPPLAQDMSALVRGRVTNMYGPTETTIWSAVHDLTAGEGAPPIGRPLLNQSIHILDRRQEPVMPGAPGELVIGGDGVVRGYLNRPELTAERFIADPFVPGRRAYRTGDLARHRADGTLEFLGRLDHQVKLRGYRIELGEIEAALRGDPAVRDAVVIARGTAPDLRLIGYIVGDADTEALKQQLRTGLPEFMVPAQIVRLDRLPRTPNGKLDRNALPEPLTFEMVREDAPSSPDTPLQAQILGIWRDVLKLPRVGVRDNFFDIGGHSLLAVQVHRRLSQVVDHPIALTDIFRFPTVEALSAHVGGGVADAAPTATGQDRARSRRLAMQRRATAPALARS